MLTTSLFVRKRPIKKITVKYHFTFTRLAKIKKQKQKKKQKILTIPNVSDTASRDGNPAHGNAPTLEDTMVVS